jgi:hypothetical protein
MRLEGMFFDTTVAFLSEVEETLGDKSIREWDTVFDEWKERLKQCIDAEREYF